MENEVCVVKIVRGEKTVHSCSVELQLYNGAIPRHRDRLQRKSNSSNAGGYINVAQK
jgi:hypothetical protein